MTDKVNHPKHYNRRIEVIDFIEDYELDFHLGNVVKYIARHKDKGEPLEDLKKAAWYLNRHIEKMENKNMTPRELIKDIVAADYDLYKKSLLEAARAGDRAFVAVRDDTDDAQKFVNELMDLALIGMVNVNYHNS